MSTTLSTQTSQTSPISQEKFGFRHRWSKCKKKKQAKIKIHYRCKMFLWATCWKKVWWCIWLTTNTSFPTLVQGKSYNSCLTDPTFCNTDTWRKRVTGTVLLFSSTMTTLLQQAAKVRVEQSNRSTNVVQCWTEFLRTRCMSVVVHVHSKTQYSLFFSYIILEKSQRLHSKHKL